MQQSSWWFLSLCSRSFGCFSVSLQNNDEITAIPITLVPSIPQWGNYAEAFTSGPFLQYLGNSVIIIVSIIVIQMAVMIPAAYGFAKYEFKGKNFLFGLVMLAFMTPVQLTFLPIYNMMSKAGLMDTLLPQILPSHDECIRDLSAKAVFHADSGRTHRIGKAGSCRHDEDYF